MNKDEQKLVDVIRLSMNLQPELWRLSRQNASNETARIYLTDHGVEAMDVQIVTPTEDGKQIKESKVTRLSWWARRRVRSRWNEVLKHKIKVEAAEVSDEVTERLKRQHHGELQPWDKEPEEDVH